MFNASGFLSAGPEKGLMGKIMTDVKNLNGPPFCKRSSASIICGAILSSFSLLLVVDERWRGVKWLGSGLAEGLRSCNKTVVSLGFVDCAGSIPRSGLKFL